MKTLTSTLVLALTLGFISLAQAGEEKTFEGTLSCLKCNLKKADSCADALQVKDGDKTVTYHLEEKGKVKTSAHQCKGTASAKVTGKVEERDGTKFIVASKIEKED